MKKSKLKTYTIRPCVVLSETEVEQAESEDLADFWSVYKRDADGYLHQVSDHPAKDAATAEMQRLQRRVSQTENLAEGVNSLYAHWTKRCPKCKSDKVSVGPVDISGKYLTVESNCNECHAEWTDHYKHIFQHISPTD